MKKDPLDLNGMHNGAKPDLFKNAARLRASMTEPELKLWEYLEKKPHGFKFRRQHPIGVYILDFYCHRLRLSIEVDGGYHLNADQKEKDRNRTTYLKDMGIKELRFWNEDILNEIYKSIGIIEHELRAGPPFRAGEGAEV